MRHDYDLNRNEPGMAKGLGAGVIALLSLLGRQADDVARIGTRCVHDVGHIAIQQGDDFARMTAQSGDDVLRGVDHLRPSWALGEIDNAGSSGASTALDGDGVSVRVVQELGRAAMKLPTGRDGQE